MPRGADQVDEEGGGMENGGGKVIPIDGEVDERVDELTRGVARAEMQ